MSAKIVGLPRPAEPNIRCVFEEFIEAQRTRLAPRTLARYEALPDVLSGYLNGYAPCSPSSTKRACSSTVAATLARN